MWVALAPVDWWGHAAGSPQSGAQDTQPGRSDGIRAYRRVLTGRENCALCLVASTQRYWVEDLLPIHPGCDCNVQPLPPGMEDSQVIDQDLLERAHAAVEDRYGSYAPDARGIDYKK